MNTRIKILFRRRGWVAACLLLAQPSSSPAQQAAPKPSPTGQRFETPPVPPLDLTKKLVSAPIAAPSKRSAQARAAAGQELRVISIHKGQAEVAFGAESARTVQRGSVIAGDVVKEIGDGTIVMSRPEPGGSESLVIVTLDARGETRVRVIVTQDVASRKVTPPPAVR
ncbi:MAG: hypothetical protein ABI672_04185 [Vicinamibacteria bacterium]